VKKKVLLSVFGLLSLLALASCSGGSDTPSTPDPEPNNDPPHVHTLSTTWSSDGTNHWHTCSGCNEKFDSGDHEVKMTKTDPTCQATGSMVYTCDICGYTNTTTIEKISHAITLVEYEDRVDESQICKHEHVSVGKCDSCGEEIELSKTNYEAHEYKAKILTEATCTTPGKYLYECKHCDSTKEVEYTNPDAHDWDNGVKNGDVVTYTCKNCNATKKEIDASTAKEATVSKDALKESAVALEKATIKLDEDTLTGIGDATNVKINADTVDVEQLSVDDSVKEKIGTNEVFDFSMEADGNQVSEFDGMITITVPYTLKETDDPEAIAIWYINDLGIPESIEAKYSNGFVTFKTSHFSLYVVIQMTPADACLLFGHNYETIEEKASTCSIPGFKLIKCSRCNETELVEEELATHNWVLEEEFKPSLNTSGYKIYKCSVCDEFKVIELPKETNKEQSKLAKIINGLVKLINTDGIDQVTVSQNHESANSRAIIVANGNKVYTMSYNNNSDSINCVDFNTLTSENVGIGDYIHWSKNNIDPRSAISYDLILNYEDKVLSNILTTYFDTKLLNDWTDKILNLVIDEKQENGNIVLTFNKEKALALYDDFTNLTIKEFINKYIDANAFENLVLFIGNANDKTIGQLITEISAFGIDIDGLINFALNYYDTATTAYGIKVPTGATPTQIKAMIEQYKNLKISELLASIPNNQFSIEGIVEMINGFGNMKMEQIISMIKAPSGSQLATQGESQQPSTQPASLLPPKAMVEAMLDNIDMTITFNDKYEMKELKFKAIFSFDVDVTVKPAENAMALINAKMEEAQKTIEPLIISKENDVFGKTFNKTFKTNLTFSYSKRDEYTVIRTSPISYSKLNEILKKVNEDYRPYISNLGTSYYLVFELRDGVSAQIIEGLDLIEIYINENTSLYANTEEGPQYVTRVNIANNLVYDTKTKEYYIYNGNLDVPYILELATAEEANGKVENESQRPEDSNINTLVQKDILKPETIYLKRTNVATGDVKYYARTVYYYLENDTKYYYEGTVDYSYISSFPYLRTIDSKSISIRYIYDGSKLLMTFESDRFRGENGYQNIVSNDGKFKLEYQTINEYEVKYKLTLEGKTYDLVDIFTYRDVKTVEEVKTSRCEGIYVFIDQDQRLHISNRSMHEYEYVTLKEATLTQDGLRVRVCKNCDDVDYFDTIHPSTSDEIVFEDCSQKFDENAPVIGYYSSGIYSFSDLQRRFAVILTVVEEQDGQMAIVNSENSYNAIEYDNRETLKYAGRETSIQGRYFTFDEDDYNSLKSSLDENQYLAVGVLNNESIETGFVKFLILR